VVGSNVDTISDDCFYECEKLSKISIGKSVYSIELGAFGACISLKELFIPNNVKEISGLFFAKEGKKEVNCTVKCERDPIKKNNYEEMWIQDFNENNKGDVLYNQTIE